MTGDGADGSQPLGIEMEGAGEESFSDFQSRLRTVKETVLQSIAENGELGSILKKDLHWQKRVEFFAITQFVRDTRVAFSRLEGVSDVAERKSLQDRIKLDLVFAKVLLDEFKTKWSSS